MAYDAIIVGGGICGMSAALELAKRGQKVLVLEAQSKLGGRVESIPFKGTQLQYDTGAHWSHGGEKNPFFQQVNKEYALGPLVDDMAKSRLYVYEGKDCTKDFKDRLDGLSKFYNEMATKRHDDFTLDDVAKLIKTPKTKALLNFKAQLWMAADGPKDVSVKDMLNDPLGPGGIQMKKGMGYLILQMTKALERHGVKIMTGTPAKSVSNISDGVMVVTDDGRRFKAGNAIVTASVGVLKEKTIEFDLKTQTVLDKKLANYEMGDFFKAGLLIDEGYFKKQPVQMPADTAIWVINEKFPKFIHARSAGEPIITVFAGGAHARKLETLKPAEVKKFALAAMAETPFFKGIQKFTQGEVIATKWRSNRFIRGAYSHKKPNGEKSDPFMCGNIIFAGEAWLASAEDSPGQMAGAWKSAHKAAELVYI